MSKTFRLPFLGQHFGGNLYHWPVHQIHIFNFTCLHRASTCGRYVVYFDGSRSTGPPTKSCTRVFQCNDISIKRRLTIRQRALLTSWHHRAGLAVDTSLGGNIKGIYLYKDENPTTHIFPPAVVCRTIRQNRALAVLFLFLFFNHHLYFPP